MITFDHAQQRWDNMLPSDGDLPEVPDHLILQVCHEWAEDPPQWMREKAEEFWINQWKENRGR